MRTLPKPTKNSQALKILQDLQKLKKKMENFDDPHVAAAVKYMNAAAAEFYSVVVSESIS